MRVVLSAGEASGDFLGAHLAAALKQRHPGIEMAGIAGPRMKAQGVRPWFNLDDLNVMGLQEVLAHLPRLVRLRHQFKAKTLNWQPEVFIGIDAPDFNLGLAKRLKRHGVPTMHYVSPSVWAWRAHRIKTIAQSVDALMTLFPFEPALYEAQGLQATCVGHPAADDISAMLEMSSEITKPSDHGPIIALLPGSRQSEIDRHGPILVETASAIRAHRDNAEFIMPLAQLKHAQQMQQRFGQALQTLKVKIVTDATRQTLAHADVAITASGTVTLEAFLIGCPQVVFYRLAPVTHWLARSMRLVQSAHIALPNILAEQSVVPEFIQHDATPQALSRAALDWLDTPKRAGQYRQTAAQWREQLAAGDQAARCVLDFIQT